MRAILCLLCVLGTSLSAGRAMAQPDVAARQGTAAARPPHEAEQPAAAWSRGPMRPFFATSIDVGFLYFRPRVSVGYGQPHSTWLGLDANPIISSEGAGGWLGVRAALPNINLRFGGRYFHAFRRSLLKPQETYTITDIEDRSGPDSSYLSLEAELTGNLPLGPGKMVVELAATSVLFIKRGYHVYEETIRVVLDPPYVWRARVGYSLPFGQDGLFRVGGVVEVVGIPNRSVHILRGGLIVRVPLFRNLEARGTFIPVWASPDNLGLAGGDSFLVGVRYRWATGQPWLQPRR